MKKQRRKTSCRRTAIATTEVWDAQFRQALPAAVASALTTNQALHDWATDLGMAVLSELIGSGAKTSAGGGQRKGQPFPPFNRAPTVQPSDSALLHGPDPGQQVVEGVAIGDLLLDKYKIERIMGIGGMGVVVAAKHIHLKMRVAIKFLLPEAGQTSENLSRFLREAQLVARMKSRHVAQMLDVGTLDSGIPYMVMEYLEGKDLFEWLQDRGPLPVTQAIDFIAQACEAIHEAHGLGIVHRDLKPANLFCTTHANGQLTIKVLDFGISKVMDPGACEPESEMTQVRAVLGSPPYMSPEQSWSTRDVDERTDIWSLGVVLYELLTGHAPFSGRTDLQLRMKIATLPPPALRTRRPEIPRKLEGVVLKCLEKDRDHRYPSVAALTQALSPFGTQPTSARKTSVRGPASNSSVGVFVIAIALALFVMRDSPSPARAPVWFSSSSIAYLTQGRPGGNATKGELHACGPLSDRFLPLAARLNSW
jgi:serine/threonine protein kinase